MSQHDVSEFIVVAPANLGKAVEWAESRLLAYLGDQFPAYRFRIEPFGPVMWIACSWSAVSRSARAICGITL